MFKKIVLPLVITGLVVMLLMWISGTRIGGIFDAPTLIPVILLPFILATAGFGFKRSQMAFSAPFYADANAADQKAAIAYFNTVLSYMTGFSVLLLMTGFIGILHAFPYPEDSTIIGTNISVALLSVFYGALGSLLFVLPFRTAAASRLAEIEAQP